MNRKLDSLADVLAITIAAGYVFISRLLAQQGQSLIRDDMFISEDTDSFNPGLPVGAQFPPIRASYLGREITAVDQFIRDKGVVFIANRSVDW